ncbi:hypothetical protein SAMN02745195_01986 [Thermoanaerobacter uzonensis DSM 18761]|uniref:Uncharacterized protein n=1 Tax=Thermoanaerobacter uzonensis DSM 18761 TaxID=1123369 RepID=A0A1M4ZFK3_9THEO|nr:hypothetical protein SAMN02745195_01986 [Thermoanaerobacter uzonensis DSM 18761]
MTVIVQVFGLINRLKKRVVAK